MIQMKINIQEINKDKKMKNKKTITSLNSKGIKIIWKARDIVVKKYVKHILQFQMMIY